MQHEKIIKRPDGSRVKIEVNLHVYASQVSWRTDASFCPAGKRKFHSILTGNLYRMYLTEEEIVGYILNYATLEEIREVQMELIEKIKQGVSAMS